MGDICAKWQLLRQAGVAAQRLREIFESRSIDPMDSVAGDEFLSQNKQAAFYNGKVHTARFFIKNVLPRVDGIAEAFKNENLSVITINERGF